MMKAIILDLCGGTGAWSRPWAESGEYDVRVITLPEHDVRTYQPPEEVYGILAAPPCTMFAVSGNRWKRSQEQIDEAMEVLQACVRIIQSADSSMPGLVFWALENPVGKLIGNVLGKPVMYFDPCDYGDPWTKRTCLWGRFNKPEKNPVEPTEGSKMWLLGPTKDRAEKRSITPPGFARAFFEANRIIITLARHLQSG
jgi:hypothetical protein